MSKFGKYYTTTKGDITCELMSYKTNKSNAKKICEHLANKGFGENANDVLNKIKKSHSVLELVNEIWDKYITESEAANLLSKV